MIFGDANRKQPEDSAPPFFSATVPAGFPSPAEDYEEGPLNLQDLLVPRPASTFFVRATGDSMLGAGILPGDILVVDRSLTVRHGDIILAILDGEFTVKRLIQREGLAFLKPENELYPVIPLDGNREFEVWGCVTATIHRFR